MIEQPRERVATAMIVFNVLLVYMVIASMCSGTTISQLRAGNAVHQSDKPQTPADDTLSMIDNDVQATGWVRPPLIYGLVHMAKTAGTETNGLLAATYERVCGHKGYSYDSYQFNERLRQFASQRNSTNKQLSSKVDLHDLVSKQYPKFNRGRVPIPVQDEIGYEDCDYLAPEAPADVWLKYARKQKMELHVPCREPLSHLMSQCNYYSRTFRCDTENLEAEVLKCAIFMNRFSPILENNPNITMKCFDPLPPSRYVEYMGGVLQHRRIKSDYVHRDTNKPRNKTDECVWTAGEEFQERVRTILRENFSYYRFCDQCKHSEDMLPI